MKEHTTLGKKLAACFAAAALTSAIMGLAAWVYIAELRTELHHSVYQTARRVEIVSNIKNSIQTLRFAGRGVLLYASVGKPEQVLKSKGLLAATATGVSGAIRELEPLLEGEAEHRAAGALEKDLAEYVREQADIAAVCASGKLQEAIQMQVDRLGPRAVSLTKSVDELLSRERENNAQAAGRADAWASSSRLAVGILFALSVVLGGVGAVIIGRSTGELRSLAGQLGEGADQIAGAAGQVASSSESLARASFEQAASLEETSSASHQIGCVASKNAGNSKIAIGSMAEETARIDEANGHLAQMVRSMDEINASSGKISKIIKVIDEIAFQTNILALNAAVEAARAGEAGMGFAVVADAVRNLAHRCAQAAGDTAALIEESIAKSNDGKTKLDLVSAAVRSITGSADRVQAIIEEVNRGSQEQSLAIQQVVQTIEKMERVTQTTAAHAEEGASAGEELSAHAEALTAMALSLTEMVGSGQGRAPTA